MDNFNRRDFLRTSLIGGLAAGFYNPLKAVSFLKGNDNISARVSLTSGDNRADLVFRALKPFSEQIRQSIGRRLVILKPNVVLNHIPLACTHVDTLEGILEFLKSINKMQNVIIAESSASGPTYEGFDNYGYFRLVKKYPVRLVDLDQESFETLHVINQKDFRPYAVRIAGIMLDSNSYIISVARMKTHNSVVATLSLKNIVLGAPIKDQGFTLYSEDKRFTSKAVESRPGTASDKRLLHGSGFHAINYNIFALARQLHPHLAVIDGYEGMEGHGPTLGTPMDHRICLASQDWLAADRVGIELMGIDFSHVGYLNYCVKAGLGIADLEKIEIVGEDLAKHVKTYKLPDNIDRQLMWMRPL